MPTTETVDGATTMHEIYEEAKEHSSQDNSGEQLETSGDTTHATASEDATEESGKQKLESEDKAANQALDTADVGSLLTEEEKLEYDTLDPDAKLKRLDQAFTQKTQSLAEERKKSEEVQRQLNQERSKYADFNNLIEAYEKDPARVVRDLAAQNGLTIQQSENDTLVREQAAGLVSSLRPVLEKHDLGFLAEEMAPVLEEWGKNLTKSAVEPIQQEQDRTMAQAASEKAMVALNEFTQSHPDAPKYEKQMVALAQNLQPQGMTEREWLETLYQVAASKDLQKAAADKAASEARARFTKSARNSESSSAGVPDKIVKQSPPDTASFLDAYDAAKRGESWRG